MCNHTCVFLLFIYLLFQLVMFKRHELKKYPLYVYFIKWKTKQISVDDSLIKLWFIYYINLTYILNKYKSQ